MSMKPKTARRLALVGILAFLVIVAAVSFFGVRKWQNKRRMDKMREDGVAYFEKGDYPSAVDHIGMYLRKPENANDREAWLMYAKSREKVEDPDGGHIPQAISAYEKCRNLDVSDKPTQIHLCKLYVEVGAFPEARDLARKLRPASLRECKPEHLEVMRYEALSILGLRQSDSKLLDLFQRIVELGPQDLESQFLYVYALRENKRTPDAITHAEQVRLAYPNDPRFGLLVAMSKWNQESNEGGPELLEAAAAAAGLDLKTGATIAKMDLSDERYYNRLINFFDGFRQGHLTLGVLREASTQGNGLSKEWQSIFARRLWQAGRSQELLDRFPKPDLSPSGTHSDVLAYRALACEDLGQPTVMTETAQAMTLRPRDFRARGWAFALKAFDDSSPAATLESISMLRSAVKEAPAESTIHYFLGERLERIGRVEEARKAWSDAGRLPLAVVWPMPWVRISASYLAEGRPEAAFSAAQDALRVAPNNQASIAAWLAAQVSMIETGLPVPTPMEKLLEQLDTTARRAAEMQAQTGSKEALHVLRSILSGRVLLRCRTGKVEEAKSLLDDGITRLPNLSIEQLSHLAMISHFEKLGLSEKCLAISEERHGISPITSLTRALLMSYQGKSADGLSQLKEAQKKAPQSQDTDWQQAVARYLDAINDPSAARAWGALADGHADRMDIQLAALRSNSVASDAVLVQRLTERIAKLGGSETGPTPIVVRLAKARSLLMGQRNPRTRDEAVSILRDLSVQAPDVVECRKMLVDALLLDDPANGIKPNIAAAIDQLRTIARTLPDKSAITLQIAELLQRQRDYKGAKAALEPLANDTTAAMAYRAQAIDMLVNQTDYEAAVAPLESLVRDAGSDASVTLLLRAAVVYTALGRDGDAMPLYRRLQGMRVENPDHVLQIADALANKSDMVAARSVLAKLDDLQLPPGKREIVTSRFARRHDSPELALQFLQQATRIAPTNPDTWAELISFHVERKDFAAAAQAADSGLAAIPGEPRLNVMKEQVRLALGASSGAEESLDELVRALEKDPKLQGRSEAVRAVSEAQKSGKLSDPAAIVEIAGRFPGESPIQRLAVSLLMGLDPPRYEQAATIAKRSLSAFPSDVEVVQQAVSLFRSRGEWEQCLAAARTWQQLTRTREADQAAAEAFLSLGQPRPAMDQIRRHIELAKQKPDSPEGLDALNLQARALVAAGQSKEAFSLLSPLVQSASILRRQVFMPIAASTLPDEAEVVAWLDFTAPMVRESAVEERLAYASAWAVAGTRFKKSQKVFASRAIDVLLPITLDSSLATAPAFESLGFAYQVSADYPKAIEAYKRATELDPKSVRGYDGLASVTLLSGGDPNSALTYAKRAAEITEHRVRLVLATLAKCYEASGQAATAKNDAKAAADAYGEASKIYRKMLDQDPNDLAASLALVPVAEAMNDYDTAISTYERILARVDLPASINKPAIQNNLAYSMLLTGRGAPNYDRARSLVNEAISAAEVGTYYDTLGAIEAARRDNANAIRAYRKALVLEPKLTNSKIELAAILASGNTENKAEAKRLIAEVDSELRTVPPLPQKALQTLENARKAVGQ